MSTKTKANPVTTSPSYADMAREIRVAQATAEVYKKKLDAYNKKLTCLKEASFTQLVDELNSRCQGMVLGTMRPGTGSGVGGVPMFDVHFPPSITVTQMLLTTVAHEASKYFGDDF